MANKASHEKFYVILERGKNGSFKSCTISLNGPNPEETSKKEAEKNNEPSNENSEQKTDFATVVNSFQSNLDGYRNFIPLTFGLGSHIAYQMGFSGIHSLAEEKGSLVPDHSNDQRQTFVLDISHYQECSIVSERMDIAVKGANQLPEIMLIGLVSAYDAMLGQLLNVVFHRHQEIVLTTEKTLKFSDLLTYGSIDAAKSALIEKEIETILRESHHAQFATMEKKFSVKLKVDLSIWPAFVELCERRNLITHTGGVISEQYLSSGRANKFDVSKLSVGQKLKVDNEYYAKAVDAVYEVGVKLCHVFWRKFAPSENEQADAELNRLGYSLILDRNYRLAEAVLTFAVALKKHHSDKIRRMMVVNLANAIRLQKRPDEAKAILQKEDWSAVGAEFRVCVAAVFEDVDTVARIMLERGKDGPVGEGDYRNWPVFRGLRTNEKFADAFEKIFGSKLLTPKKAVLQNVSEPANQLSPPKAETLN